MFLKTRLSSIFLGVALLLNALPAQAALVVQFDYSLDTGNFFTQDKRQVLNQVASIFESNLNAFGPALSNQTFRMNDFRMGPANDAHVYVGTGFNYTNQSLAADTVRIYVGSIDLIGSVVGLAVPGITSSRALPGRLGGRYSGMLFDSLINWYIDADIRTAETRQVGLDFATVVMHEMGHIFGLQHSSNPEDAMWPSTDGSRSLFDPNDWRAMQAAGWLVNSLTPEIPAPETDPVGSVPEPSIFGLVLLALAAAGVSGRARRCAGTAHGALTNAVGARA